MTGEPGAKDPSIDEGAQGEELLGLEGEDRDAALAWVGEHLPMVRQTASGQRVQYWILAIAVVLGLAAHVGGFLLRESVTADASLLLADLLYSLGFALWTGVVVAIFVQIWPDAKRRQYQQALDAYEAAVGRQPRVGSDPTRAKDA